MENIFYISLLCIGLHTITREGAILGFVEKMAWNEDERLRSYLLNCLSECPVCMPSFWGVMYFYFTGEVLDLYFLFFLALYLLILLFDIWIDDNSKVSSYLYLCLFTAIVFVIPYDRAIIDIICSTGAVSAVYAMKE